MVKTLKNNKGFSLVELLVVVAIIGLMTAFITIAYSIVTRANVEKVANNMNAAINNARTQCMARGKDAGQLNIWYENNTLFYSIGKDNTNGQPIGTGSVTVNFDDTLNPVSSSTVGASAPADGTVYVYRFNSAGMLDTTTSSSNCRWTFINNKRGSEVIIYPETGKHETHKFLL